MLRDTRVFCDCCGAPMGQLWALPAQAPELLDRPRVDLCPDCVPVTLPALRIEVAHVLVR